MKTGKEYRLLTEAEREYATRVGTNTPFWWGRTITLDQANYSDYSLNTGGEQNGRGKTLPVKSFPPNSWGLYQVHGNVWERVQDCWHDDYNGAPDDGSVWAVGKCESRIVRGGSFILGPQSLRAAHRSMIVPYFRDFDLGFRDTVARRHGKMNVQRLAETGTRSE